MSFATTAQLGIVDIDGWQTAKITLTTPVNCNRILWFMQDGDDYTTYTHGFELENVQCEQSSIATPFVNGTRSNTQAILDLTNNNTVTANSLTYASDGAFSFNGTSNFATIPTQVLLKTSATVSAWINIDDFTTGKSSTGRIFLRLAGSNFTSMISFYNNGFGFESNSNSTPHELAGRTTGNIVSSTISAGSWFNFALIFDNNNFYGYANGVLIGSGALSDNLTIDRIGDGTGLSTSYPAFFKGRIPTLTIHNRALSAAEVQQNFNALRSRYGI
jgi:hypothetical protein